LHCTSCIAHNNMQQNIMAAFLARKLVCEKNGRLKRHGWEKEVEICGKERKDSWAKVLKSLRVQNHPFFLKHGRIFSINGKPQQVWWSFPLKGAWWPIFFITQKYCRYYPPKFRKKNKKNCLNENKHKWGKIGSSYLLSENGDLSFLLFFFLETMIGGEHSGKVSKKFIGNFFFWGIT